MTDFSWAVLGMPDVIEHILNYLDCNSLCKVQQVCHFWNETVKNGLSWRRQLQHQVSLSIIKLIQILNVITYLPKNFQVSSNVLLDGIYNQLPVDNGSINNELRTGCPAKEKLATIFKTAKVLVLIKIKFYTSHNLKLYEFFF